MLGIITAFDCVSTTTYYDDDKNDGTKTVAITTGDGKVDGAMTNVGTVTIWLVNT